MLCVTRVVGAQLPAFSTNITPHTNNSISYLLNFVPCILGTQWKGWQVTVLAAARVFPVPEQFFKHIQSLYLFSWLPKLTSCPWRWMSRMKSNIAPDCASVPRAHLWQGVGERRAGDRHLHISYNICWPAQKLTVSETAAVYCWY